MEKLVVLMLTLALLMGCNFSAGSSDLLGPPPACASGSTQPCLCAAAPMGLQRCLPSGLGWGACACQMHAKDAGISSDATAMPDVAPSCPVGRSPCGAICANLRTDPNNCGTCGNTCADGQRCEDDACVSGCSSPRLICSGACVDPTTDGRNCGMCGIACPSGAVCADGGCSCIEGRNACGGRCVDTQSDNGHCGACARACPSGQNCVSGVCQSGCPAPNQMCGGACTSVATDATNCGGCGRVCPASQACVAGACACPSGRTACGAACVDTNFDPNNCGACGNVCPSGQCLSRVCTTPTRDAGPTPDLPTTDVLSGSCATSNLGSAIGMGIVRGSTAGRASLHTPPPTCVAPATAPSPDIAFVWTAPASGAYTFDTIGSTYDTVLALRSGSCDGPSLECSDDIASGMTASRFTVTLAAGQSVLLIVDGYGGESGAFVVNVQSDRPIDAGVPCASGTVRCSGRCVDIASDPANCGGCGVACSTRCAVGRCTPPTWTILVYGHADHELTPPLVIDLDEMSRAALGTNVNVIVMADWDASARIGDDPEFNALWTRLMPSAARTGGVFFPSGTQWLRVPGGGRQLELVQTSPEQNLDDPSVMAEAVRNALVRYPADRYGIVFWDHGGSWRGGFGSDSQNTHSLSTGRRPGTGIGVQAIAGALRSALSLAGLGGRRLEFIAFDTCLLGSVEAAYPLRDLAHVYLAEAEVDFGRGWDYAATLSRLAADPSISAQAFARAEIADWSTHHSSATPADLLIRSAVALDLARMDALAAATRTFTSSLLTDPMMATPSVARATVRSAPVYRPTFEPGTEAGAYRDFGQVLDSLGGLSIAPTTRSALAALSSALDATILARDQGSIRALARQRGVQIALPEWITFTDSLEGTYRSNASEWSGATRWSELISALSPGSVRAPVISATWSNTSNADGISRPRVNFTVTGEPASALVLLLQLDLASPVPGYQWRLLGVVASASIDPGVPYQYVWNGLRMELPDGQPILTLPFLRTYDASSMSTYPLESGLGVCVGIRRSFACALVWEPSSLRVSLIADISDPQRPRYYVPATMARIGVTGFLPVYVMQNNAGASMNSTGRTIPFPADGRFAMRRVPAAAGAFEATVGARDVYGQTGGVTRTFITRAAFGP